MGFSGGHGGSADLASWVNRTVERNEKLIPLYARAVEEENLQDILLVRRQMLSMVEEADRMIVDRVVRNIGRSRDDG